MKKFSRSRTLYELRVECNKRNWPLDTARYYERGDDHVSFKFSFDGTEGRVLFNTTNGRFFGTAAGAAFSSDESRFDRKTWFKELLKVAYV